MVIYKSVNTLEELDDYLNKNIDSSQTNIINYISHEYGYIPFFINDYFKEWFDNIDGRIILGICLPGMELFYENKVDILITLNNFIDTERAYKNNLETDLLLKNFKKSFGHYKTGIFKNTYLRTIKRHYNTEILKYKGTIDRGVSFWYTIKNFDEEKYNKIISKYKWNSIIYPIGQTDIWEHALWGNMHWYKYGYSNQKKICKDLPNKLTTKILKNKIKIYYNKNTDFTIISKYKCPYWNLENWKFEKIKFNFKKPINIVHNEYSVIFVKNTWKTREYRNMNKLPIVGKNGMYGDKNKYFPSFKEYIDIINWHIKNNIYIYLILDLVGFKYPKNQYVVPITMNNYLNCKYYVSIVEHSKLLIGTGTSLFNIALYYCNTNFLLISRGGGMSSNDKVCKDWTSWSNKICKIRNKKFYFNDLQNKDCIKKIYNYLENIYIK